MPNPAYLKVQQESQLLVESVSLPVLNEDEIKKTRPKIKKVAERSEENIAIQIAQLVYEGDYRLAYSIHCQSGINVSQDPHFREILEGIVDDAMRGDIDDIDGRYFRLFYLLGEDFDVAIVPGLKELISLVFNKYNDEILSTGCGDGPLRRLSELFGSQIDFGWYKDSDWG